MWGQDTVFEETKYEMSDREAKADWLSGEMEVRGTATGEGLYKKLRGRDLTVKVLVEELWNRDMYVECLKEEMEGLGCPKWRPFGSW